MLTSVLMLGRNLCVYASRLSTRWPLALEPNPCLIPVSPWDPSSTSSPPVLSVCDEREEGIHAIHACRLHAIHRGRIHAIHGGRHTVGGVFCLKWRRIKTECTHERGYGARVSATDASNARACCCSQGPTSRPSTTSSSSLCPPT